ncbi:S-crystallin SL11-like [Lineus longissimus]|uniref:S-crystallin SL11-like n=1 Tax=Lineus longissimus TaxID=88925 RepID=UPI002B4D0D37
MPKYHLHYFNGRGRAEVARLLFVAAGVEFEDVRIPFSQEDPGLNTWKEKKSTYPYKQVPVLYIDGVERPLTQSFAIHRYLAREFGMIGKDSFETALVEEVIELTTEIWMPMAIAKWERDETRRAELTKQFRENKCPTVLGYLEEVLRRNNGGDGFFVGDSLTVADLAVYNTLESMLVKPYLGTDWKPAMAKFPKLEALFHRISKIPTIAAYFEKRPDFSF